MTYDYADWSDENYGSGHDTVVTLTLECEAVLGGSDAVMFVTQALDGDVRLSFTLAPEDTLDLLIRVVRYGDVNFAQLRDALTCEEQRRKNLEENPGARRDVVI